MSDFSTDEPVRVVFVCWGNICRSPMAERVAEKLAADRGLDDLVFSSAATSREEIGAPIDDRAVEVLRRHGIACDIVPKHFESAGRNAVALIEAGEIAMIINTPQGSGASARLDGYEIRSAAVTADIPCITTVPGAAAAVMGIEALMRGDMTVRPLQELHAALRGRPDEG